MAHIYSIRHRFSGKVLHVVQTGDRKVNLCAPDLSGLDLSNLILNEADLEWANLSNVNLLGTKLKGASLFHANLTGADMRYCDVSGTDFREAILENVDDYPLNADKHTKLSGARISRHSELATLSREITAAKLRRSGEPDEIDLHVARKATESLLDPNTKRLERTVSRERRGWYSGENAVLKAKMRVLRYTREIELNRARRERDLRFLRKQRVDLSFASRLTSENEIG